MHEVMAQTKMETIGRQAKTRRCGPVVIYQMGKVGSSSLHAMMSHARPRLNVFHVHTLDCATIGQNVVKHENWEEIRHVRDSIEVRRRYNRLLKNPVAARDRKWKIITPVREPIGRNLSGFFMNHNSYIENMIERFDDGTLSVQEIRDIYLKKYDHRFFMRWFEREYKTLFGLDVLQIPFDKQRGFILLKTDEIDFLLMRTGKIKEIPLAFYARFVKADEVNYHQNNTAKDKPYAHVYRTFKQQVRFPAEYISEMYDNDFVRHFWRDDQIAAFKQQYM